MRFLLCCTAVLLAGFVEAAPHHGSVQSAGQPIPGALVVATKGAEKLVTTTDELGLYTLGNLTPGAWAIEVRMFGFVTAHRELVVGTDPTTVDWNLELQPRPAAAAPPKPLNGFQSLALSQVVEGEILNALEAPALAVAPVAEAESANEVFLISGSLSTDLDAQPPTQPQASLEQASTLTEQMRQNTNPTQPLGPGTAPNSAAGRRRAAIIKEVLRRRAAANKTGKIFGNRKKKAKEAFRGAVYAIHRNSALDARPYSLTGETVGKPVYTYNRFGIAAGGLLHIPRLIESENTMFFVNYSGTRSAKPSSEVAKLPTLLERGGYFSESAVRALPIAIFDPASGLPFPGRTIPDSRMSAQALGLLSFIPMANQPSPLQNYQFVTAEGQDSDNLNVRVSRPVALRDRVALAYNFQRRDGENTQVYGYRDETSGRTNTVELSWVRNLGPRLLNVTRTNFARNVSHIVPFFANTRDVAAELGIAGPSSDPINFGPPNLSFTNFGDLTDGSPFLRRDQSIVLIEGLTMVRGAHTITLGGEYRRSQLNRRTDQNARGTFTFSGLATSGFDERRQPLAGTGYDFADFLLGLPQSSSIRFGSDNNYFRSTSYNGYVLDDWKTRPNLSLNLGLRYEFLGPYSEKHNRMSNLDVAPGFTRVVAVTPGESGPYSGVFPRALVEPDHNNVSPRLGLAWKPLRGRPMLVRTGYGLYYNTSVYSTFPMRLASQPPFAETGRLSTSVAHLLTLADGFAISPTVKIRNTYAVDRGYRVGYAQSWNLAVQYELPNALVLDVGYRGIKGTHLDVQRQPNRAAPGSPLTAEQRRLIGDAVGFTFNSAEGNSIYHALQVRVARRFRKGVSTNLLYTWSKSIDNTSTFSGVGNSVAQNDKDLRSERGLSSFDQRHTLGLNYVLMSPVGRATSWIRAEGWSGRLLKDWVFSGGLTARTGVPFTARVLGNRADSGGTGVVGSGRADATGAPVNAGEGFFNLDAFRVPPAGRFGNAGRNTIPGPSLFSLNMALSRSFRLGLDRRRLEFRFESTNLTNSVSFIRLATVVNAVEYGLPVATAAMRTFSATLRFRF